MPTRAELEAEAERLEKALDAVRAILFDLDVADCPTKVGDIVISTRDDEEYLVVEIHRPDWRWVIGSPRKADGSWSKKRRHLFDRYRAQTTSMSPSEK